MAKSRVVQPDEGQSFWQPVPANGHVEIKVEGGADGMSDFDCGVQEVAPGSYVREHAHDRNEELIFVFAGEGEAEVDGETHPMAEDILAVAALDNGASICGGAGGEVETRGGDGGEELWGLVKPVDGGADGEGRERW